MGNQSISGGHLYQTCTDFLQRDRLAHRLLLLTDDKINSTLGYCRTLVRSIISMEAVLFNGGRRVNWTLIWWLTATCSTIELSTHKSSLIVWSIRPSIRKDRELTSINVFWSLARNPTLHLSSICRVVTLGWLEHTISRLKVSRPDL